MRLCPRCHTSHPDHVLVCHSAICGDVGTPLVVHQHEVTQPLADPLAARGRPAATATPQPSSRPRPAPGPELQPPLDPTGSMALEIDPPPPGSDVDLDDDDELAFAGDASFARGSGSEETAAMRPPGRRSPAASSPPPMSAPAPAGPMRGGGAGDMIGAVLGSYKLLAVIGRGGMGRVYRAEHVKLGRHVALKLLKPEYAVKRDAVARFFQEAKAVNRIRHRNIVDVTDFVELDDGTTFIIMELLEGASLGKELRTRGPMPAPRLLAVLVQVCDALEAAHAVDIVHRDLKPDNIFLVKSDGDDALGEVAKLLDFGVAKLLSEAREPGEEYGYETAAGSVVGTPAYMSPEQAGGLEVDGRSDVYALGAIMYELFCGQPLFQGKSFGEFVLKHMNEAPVPPHQTPGGADMAPELEEIILRCLEKRPENRFQTVAELRERLLRLLGTMDTGLVDLRRGSGLRRASGLSGPSSVASSPSARSTPAPRTPAPRATLPEVPPETLAARPQALPPVALETRLAVGDLQVAQPAQLAPRSRWWVPVALLGGVAAAAVVGFVVAAGGEGPAASAPPSGPTVTPVAPMAPPSAGTGAGAGKKALEPITVPVRTDPVGADVYAYGSDEPLCRTPCDLVIDPGDGGSTTRRTFLIKKARFQPYPFEVALDAPPPDELVLLLPEEQVRPDKDKQPGKQKDGKDKGKEKVAVEPPPPPPPPPDDKPPPPPPDDKADKNDKKQDKKDKIDRTETLDPFGKKK